MNCINQARMRIAERGDRMAAVEIENAPPVGREDVATGGAFGHERQLTVDRQCCSSLAGPGVGGRQAI